MSARLPIARTEMPGPSPRAAPPLNGFAARSTIEWPGLSSLRSAQPGPRRGSLKAELQHSVAVVVPTWNCGPYLADCLDSLLAQECRCEIVVVADGSPDGSWDLLQRYAHRVRLIRHDRRRGANAARNTGLRATASEWVIFADADAVYRADWIARMLEAAADDRRIAVVYSGFTRQAEFGSPGTAEQEQKDARMLLSLRGGGTVGRRRAPRRQLRGGQPQQAETADAQQLASRDRRSGRTATLTDNREHRVARHGTELLIDCGSRRPLLFMRAPPKSEFQPLRPPRFTGKRPAHRACIIPQAILMIQSPCTVAWILQDAPELELVSLAAEGMEAVELAERLMPDVILMDVSMPKLDRMEATRQITAICPQMWVIALLLHERDFAGPNIQAAGAVGYVSKSASSADIVAAIRAAVPQT